MMYKNKEVRLFICLYCLMSLGWFPIPDARGELTHRYSFSGKTLADSVGGENGQCPATADFVELQYADEVPPQAAGISLSFANIPEGKMSGFSLPGRVLGEEKGSYTLWIKPLQQAGAGNDFVLSAVPLGQGASLVIFENSATILANIQGKNIEPFPLISLDEWYHVAVVWDSTKGEGNDPRALVYVNGEMAGSVVLDGPLFCKILCCGAFTFPDGNDFADTQYRGLLYDLQIYDNPLTHEQVRQLYQKPGVTLDDPAGDAPKP